MHEPIPSDFPVQPLKPGEQAECKATCGHCGLSWDDAKPTIWTPAPSGRCPFEYFHVYDDEDENEYVDEDPEDIAVGRTTAYAFLAFIEDLLSLEDSTLADGGVFLSDAIRQEARDLLHAAGWITPND